MKTRNVLAYICLILLCSCSKSERASSSSLFPGTEMPNAISVGIDEILKPMDLVALDDYVAILHDERATGEQVYVYSADCYSYKYKFEKRGRGPLETLALDVIKNPIGNYIDLVDQSDYKWLRYELKEDSAEFVSASYLKIPNVGPLQESYWVNDSIIVFNTLDNSILTYNVLSKEILDTFSFSDYFPSIDEGIQRKFCGFGLANFGNKLVVCFRNVNYLTMGYLDENYHICFPNFKVNVPHWNTSSIYKNIVYYAYVSMNEKTIVAQFYGYPLSEMQPRVKLNRPNLKFNVEIYDDGLNPKCLYANNLDVQKYFFDGKRERILYWDAYEDFTQLMYWQL